MTRDASPSSNGTNDRSTAARGTAVLLAALLMFGGVVAVAATPATAHFTECNGYRDTSLTMLGLGHSHDHDCDDGNLFVE